MNRIKKITLFLLVFTLVFASAFFLVACNEQQEDEGDITRDLYVYAIAFEDAGATEEESSAKVQADADSSADKTAIVYLTFSKTDRKIEGANALWHSEKRKDGEFYFVTTIKISLSPESIFSAVKESIPQEDLVKDEVEYNRLKVVLRYDTIYKSIKSNGEITHSGRIYTHAFALDENLSKDHSRRVYDCARNGTCDALLFQQFIPSRTKGGLRHFRCGNRVHRQRSIAS